MKTASVQRLANENGLAKQVPFELNPDNSAAPAQ
jgi:hypothetical protein